ncbi:hypothetical protein MKW98_007552 [Papaver atlanticum]|uniref:DUF6469 domain-containing protein n=1 Tax=Papaver atlanticum TaxID=357466 RepID=A0AAD4SBF1_9MAGN|nr:hypothetical protein MKW98_007552 [Papaver atlanticum]
MATTSGTKDSDEPSTSSSSSSSVKDLIEHVFSWSIQDILNDDLYKHKVETVPKRFESVQHYFSSYTMPLLEETRMEICAQMEFMSGVPHAEVISVEESKLHGGSFLYCIKRFGGNWSLASVVEDVKGSDSVGEEDRLIYFQVKTSKPIKIEMKEGMRKSLFVVFLVNLAMNTRTWKALHMFRNSNIINEVLCANSMVKENCGLCSAQVDRIWDGKVDT